MPKGWIFRISGMLSLMSETTRDVFYIVVSFDAQIIVSTAGGKHPNILIAYPP